MMGWQCPKCGRCYSPFVSVCGFCGPRVQSISTRYVPYECYEYYEDFTYDEGLRYWLNGQKYIAPVTTAGN